MPNCKKIKQALGYSGLLVNVYVPKLDGFAMCVRDLFFNTSGMWICFSNESGNDFKLTYRGYYITWLYKRMCMNVSVKEAYFEYCLQC